ncbi:MAG: carbon-nitrogen hydrolase family protein [Myxococcota bacterium]
MKVALAQLNSARDIDANLATCRRLAEQAADEGADWLLFPENAPFLGKDREKLDVAEPLDGPMIDAFRQMARDAELWLTVGSFPETSPSPDHTFNTQVLLSPTGETHSVYRKMHLFDVTVDAQRSYRESDTIKPGAETALATVATSDDTADVGQTICYDLRFPELYRDLVARGANVLTVPSAFTLQTGRDHWHALLRARAIENQAYVLAPDQWGTHFGDRASYGHSVVYDPWGQRLACAPDKVGIVTAELDFGYLRDVRQRMPSLEHRRLGLDEPT